MHRYHISRDKALAQLREGRPVCGPNDGFMKQLNIYHEMLKAPDVVEAEFIYERWFRNRPFANIQAYERLEKL